MVLGVDGRGAQRDGLRLQNHLGEAEIENLRHSTTSPEDIGRLDVAMNDALRMGGVESVCDFDAKRQDQFGLQGRPARRFSVVPSRYSIAMKGWPSCSPMS